MRVTFTHKEQTYGLLRRRPYIDVIVKVDFTDEELAVIKKNNFKDLVILEREPPYDHVLTGVAERGDVDPLTVEFLMFKHGCRYAVKDVVSAKNYEAEVTQALREFKEILDDAAEGIGGPKTFEI